MEFNPFADDVAAATIGGLTVENGMSAITVHGDLVIGRTGADLEALRSLVGLLGRIEAAIAAGAGADVAGEAAPVDEVENPF